MTSRAICQHCGHCFDPSNGGDVMLLDTQSLYPAQYLG